MSKAATTIVLNTGFLTILLLLLQSMGCDVYLALRLDSTAPHNQVWRLLTASFVHLGWAHTLINIFGIFVCAQFVPKIFDRYFWWRLLALACGISLCLTLFPKEGTNYAGLSAALYGLLAWGLWQSAVRGETLSGLALLLSGAWAWWQWHTGGISFEAHLIGGKIAGIAHIYGWVLGVLLAIASRSLKAGFRFG